MTIYDEVKAQMGEGPAYPSRADYTTYFGYTKGKALGSFATQNDALSAGATSVVASTDERGYTEARRIVTQYEKRVMDEWQKRVRARHPDLNDGLWSIISSAAYEQGHSSGMHEVELLVDDYVDLAQRIIAAAKG